MTVTVTDHAGNVFTDTVATFWSITEPARDKRGGSDATDTG